MLGEFSAQIFFVPKPNETLKVQRVRISFPGGQVPTLWVSRVVK